MNKKLLATIFLLCALTSFAGAFEYGDTITQAQYNQIDFFTRPLNWSVERYQISFEGVGPIVSFDALEPQENGTYLYTRSEKLFDIPFLDVFRCVTAYNFSTCKTKAEEKWLLMGRIFFNNYREKLDSQKTAQEETVLDALRNASWELNVEQFNDSAGGVVE